jgi:ABC-type multidrug transport system fused ATPase/permease subunit
LKQNIDPFEEYSDESIWEAITKVNLKKLVEGNKGLLMEIKEKGENLSVGEKQLICCARALLKKCKLLI